ncbi:prepilin-type N-terminal cleavage/methylation domain-containing protein [Halobacteroides halobius DSM 5150]|uniref:Prepilin-type N-terminal cleavage/methylation domain-containing protein n=1 Tax=Halobacteroides halobius (strain ATCC 35273 / DSM 5150 / MD-1) TaxID=748449 RepID=L0K813_HALHC|nr:prepilin-type N-terminal cleavage/methylation domain-containing protein [Halobacteroides halobius]AGB40494.1 prepilin-type N-terminal cleavage/methylation domain-containing protein [Halobacteroides halobius DSM 5150]
MQNRGFTLIEIMLLLAVSGIILSSLVVVNQTMLRTWQSNKLQASLEQELRVSMNSIVKHLQSALKIKRVTTNKISFLDQQAKLRVIYYQSNTGLCLDSDLNVISKRISNLNYKLLNQLLVIKLEIAEQGQSLSLKTAIKLQEKQL